VRAGAEDGVGDGEAGELGDPQACLDADRQQRVIAAAGPGGGVRGREQRAGLFPGQEAYGGVIVALAR